MATIRARIDLARVANRGVDPTRLTPPRIEEVKSDLLNRGLVADKHDKGWWTGDDAVIRTLGDAAGNRPPGGTVPADRTVSSRAHSPPHPAVAPGAALPSPGTPHMLPTPLPNGGGRPPAPWRNWQTQRIQNPSPIKRVGSSPTGANHSEHVGQGRFGERLTPWARVHRWAPAKRPAWPSEDVNVPTIRHFLTVSSSGSSRPETVALAAPRVPAPVKR